MAHLRGASPPQVGNVFRGKKVLIIGKTGGKLFAIRYDMLCPALEAALHAQPISWYIAVPFGCPFRFACADHMYTPVFPMAAPGCCACSVVPCSCLCAPASCPGLARGVPDPPCAVLCRASRLRWCVRRCLSAVTGD